MFTGEAAVLVSLAQLFAAVTEGPQAGRRDALTGLDYHATEPPPASAAKECMHWVSSPQVQQQHLHAVSSARSTVTSAPRTALSSCRSCCSLTSQTVTPTPVCAPCDAVQSGGVQRRIPVPHWPLQDRWAGGHRQHSNQQRPCEYLHVHGCAGRQRPLADTGRLSGSNAQSAQSSKLPSADTPTQLNLSSR